MPRRGLWTYENLVLLLFFFAWGAVISDQLGLSYLMPFIRKTFNLTNTQIGLMGSAAALTMGVMTYLGATISDSIGKRKPFIVAAILTFSLLSFLTGVATSFLVLLVIRAIMGLIEGPILPVMQSVMAVESSETRRGFNMTVLQSVSGTLIATVAAPPILVALATHYSWRIAFFLTLVPGLIISILIAKFVREPKTKEVPFAAVRQKSKERVNYGDIFRNRNIWVCLGIGVCVHLWFGAIFGFGPLFMTEARHLSPTTMSLVMSALGLGGTVWGLIVPALSDRFGRKPIMVIFSLIGALVPLSLLVIPNITWMIVCVVLFNVAGGPAGLYMATIPAESVPSKYVAGAMGLIQGFGALLGVVTSTVNGMLADHYGLPVLLWIGTIASAIAGPLSLLLYETAPVKLRARAARMGALSTSTASEG